MTDSRFRRLVLPLAALAAASLALAGCAEGTATSSSTGSPTTLTVGLSQNPDTLDPAATSLIGATKVDAQIFDTLVYRIGGGDWTPGLATDMKVNSDATVYTFTLRKGVKFQDGTPFNGDAVKATLDHIAAQKSGSAVSALGAYEKTEVVDATTVKVDFSTSYPAFYNLVSGTPFGISSPTAMKKYGDDYGTHPVGTGPFTFKSFTSGSAVELTRNADYTWGPKAYGTGASKLKTLTFRILTDSTSQSNALTTGEIDVADGLSTQDTSTAKAAGKTITKQDAGGMPYGYMLDAAKAPTDDVAVRQAIVHAVNTKSLITTLFDGQYTQADSVLTPSVAGYESDKSAYAYDPAESKKLLDKAGWVLQSDGTRVKNGTTLTVDMIDIANFGFDGMSPIIQADLAKVGITAKVSSQAFSAVAAVYGSAGSNTASWFYWDADASSLAATFTCAQIGGFNWSNYCSKDLDTKIAAANATPDPTARAKAFKAVSGDISDLALYLPIYNLQVSLAADTSAKGILIADSVPLYAAVGR
jgi:peptide/nickel transport system substrate-binding protein